MSNAAAPVESSRVTPYHGFLFVLLSTATFFEGFDASMMSLAAPDVRAGLGIPVEQWGTLYSITRVGIVASFFLLLFADRFGRRLLLFVTVLGFGAVTGLTALARDPAEFTALQTLARFFLQAEYALAVIVIGEEFPARLRGRAIGLLASFATIGVMVMAKLQPLVLLPAGAEGNWLHDVAIAGVTALQGAFGLAEDRASWRALYFLGLPPLALVFGLRFAMRETRRYEIIAAARAPRSWREELAAQWQAARTPFRPAYLRRTLIVALLWNCVHLLTAPVGRLLGDLRARGSGPQPRDGRRHRVLGLRGGRRRQLRRRSVAGSHRPQGDLRGLLHARRHRARAAVPHAQHDRAVRLPHRVRGLLRRRDRRHARLRVRAVPDRDPRHRLRLDHEPVRPPHRDRGARR